MSRQMRGRLRDPRHGAPFLQVRQPNGLPEPLSVLLSLLALGSLTALRQRRRKHAAAV